MAFADGGVVLEATPGQLNQLVLQVVNFGDTAAAEELGLDHVIGKLGFACVNHNLAVLGLAVGNGDGHGLDAALIAAPAAARIIFGEHLMLRNGTLAGHQALGYGTAVEQDDLVLVIAVVVVPVQHGGGTLGGQTHGPHGDGGAHIDFAGGHNAPVIQLAEQHAGADPEVSLHLVPAPQSQRVQMVFVDVLVDDHAHLCQGKGVGGGDMGEVGVVFQPIQLGKNHSVVIRFALDLFKQLGKVKGFHIDAVLLHGDFIEAHGLECGGAGTDAAQVKPLHTVHDPADGCKVPEILGERGAERMHHMGLHDGERHIVLAEHVGDGELAAVGIPAMLEIHLADLVGVGLHQNGHACVLQGSDGTVFIRKDGHGEDHAVILALMLFQPLGVQAALVTGFHTAVTGQFGIHGDVVETCIGHGLDHILTGTVDQFAGHKTAVAEAKGKGHFFHVMFLLRSFQNGSALGFSRFQKIAVWAGSRFPARISDP